VHLLSVKSVSDMRPSSVLPTQFQINRPVTAPFNFFLFGSNDSIIGKRLKITTSLKEICVWQLLPYRCSVTLPAQSAVPYVVSSRLVPFQVLTHSSVKVNSFSSWY